MVKCFGRKDGAYKGIRVNPTASAALEAQLLKGRIILLRALHASPLERERARKAGLWFASDVHRITGGVQTTALLLTSDFNRPGGGEAEELSLAKGLAFF